MKVEKRAWLFEGIINGLCERVMLIVPCVSFELRTLIEEVEAPSGYIVERHKIRSQKFVGMEETNRG